MSNLIKNNKFIKIVVLCINCIFLISVSPVLGQDAYNLSVSPPTFEIYANPGDKLENSIRAENLTDFPLSIVVETRNFVAVGEEGSVNLTNEENNFSLSSWIEVTPSKIVIPPHNSQMFKFKTDVPLGAEPGGHFGSIVFKSGGLSSDLKQTGAAISQELATLILVKVSGKTTEKAKLESFNAAKKFWEYGPIMFDNRIKNEGNIHVKPTGNIIIKNIFGKQVANIEVDPKNVLPDAIRKNTTIWNKKYIFGRYTATLNLTYGNPRKTLISSTIFYGIPYKIIIIILLVSGGFTFLIYKGRKRISKALKVLFSKN